MAYKRISPTPVIEGGTGATTLTGIIEGNGSSAFTAITPADYGVLISSAVGTPSWLANGTTGQVLTATTSGTPSWENASSGGIGTLDGDSGSATGSTVTISGGTTGLTTSASSATVNLTGTLKLANGGTNADLTASNGGIFYSTATAGAILSGTSTADQVLLSGSSTAPSWSTATYPATTTINQLLYSSSNNVIGGVTAGDYGVLISSSSGVPSWLANGTTGQVLTATTSGTPSWENASGGGITTIDGDSGSVTGSTVSIKGNGATNAGSSVSFSGSGTALTFNVTDSNNNTIIGKSSGNGSLSGSQNTGIGENCYGALTSGSYNAALGQACFVALTTGSSNCAVGQNILGSLTTGIRNVGIGNDTITSITTGSYNSAFGVQAGQNYTSSESSNISIGYITAGTAGESNVLRIGSGTGTSAGNLNKAVICGINGITTSTADQVVLINSSDTLGTVAHGTSGQAFISGGSGANPSWGTLGVAGGGTGDTSFTAYAPLCGGTTTTGALQVASTGLSTSGYVLTSNGSSSLPSFQAIPASSLTWSVITSNQNAAVNNGYICNKASTLILTLPTTAAVGTIIQVTGMNTALGWSIAQNSGQQIFFGTSTTTSGTGGSLSSSNIYDSVTLVCNVANTSWIVTASIGNITVV